MRTRTRDRTLKRWLGLTGIAYAAGAAVFLARPQDAPEALSLAGGERLPYEEPSLYHALAGAYMVTIAALALGAAGAPEERRALVPPLMAAKAASSAALLYRYSTTGRRGYALASALDAAILGITTALYVRR
jgi:hypothetical protein